MCTTMDRDGGAEVMQYQREAASISTDQEPHVDYTDGSRKHLGGRSNPAVLTKQHHPPGAIRDM
jgi:hypothetical protein